MTGLDELDPLISWRMRGLSTGRTPHAASCGHTAGHMGTVPESGPQQVTGEPPEPVAREAGHSLLLEIRGLQDSACPDGGAPTAGLFKPRLLIE